MRYITGIHALNLNCSLDTCGDWHQAAIQWKKPTLKESENSIFKDYGIEKNKHVPENPGEWFIANTLRAALDILEDSSDPRFGLIQGLKEDFICNDKYTLELFNNVIKLKEKSNWDNINSFMKKEYMWEWDNFLKGKET